MQSIPNTSTASAMLIISETEEIRNPFASHNPGAISSKNSSDTAVNDSINSTNVNLTGGTSNLEHKKQQK
eukprot:Pgem_evm1s10673